MLLKHSAAYVLARGLPGILSFLSITVFTHLLTEGQYGRYALVVAGVVLLNVTLFLWIRMSVLRFLPQHLDDPKELLSTVMGLFGLMAVVSGLVGIVMLMVFRDPVSRGLILFAIPMQWSYSWSELCLELLRSKLQPLRYGMLFFIKSASTLVIGGILATVGIGAYAPLTGMVVGTLIAGGFLSFGMWKGIRPKLNREITRELLIYGLPLTATGGLEYVLRSADRFVIGGMMSEGAAGVYAAAFDLAQQTLVLLMMIVNLAAYPLAVRALEQKGEDAARRQVDKNGTLLIAVGLPAAVFMALLAPTVASALLGPAFRAQGQLIMPWIAFGAFFLGFRAYHFDLAFQLGKSTANQLHVLIAAVVVSVGLKFVLIPKWGLIGAAEATMAAYIVATFVSAWAGRKHFRIPLPLVNWGKIVLATAIMAACLWPLAGQRGWLGLLLQMVTATLIYGLAMIALDTAGSRKRVLKLVARAR
jgi:O-antigen/teichoic acid export membrane protein